MTIKIVDLPPPGKVGRNKPCWCGSGSKYKHCHLDRDKQPQRHPLEWSPPMRKSLTTGQCLFVDRGTRCTRRAIASHSIQRKGGLSAISEAGHVLSTFISLDDMFRFKGTPGPKRVGLREASTFPGFCSDHDAQIFGLIERETLDVKPESAFLFAYRAVCIEYQRKFSAYNNLRYMSNADQGHDIITQWVIQNQINLYRTGLDIGLRDITSTKEVYDKPLDTSDYSDINFFAVWFDKVLPVVTSVAVLPDFSFDGTLLQNLMTDSRLEHCTLTITSFSGSSLAIFAWIGEQTGASRAFVDSFATIPDDDKAARIVAASFALAENTHLSPSWWEGLGEVQKKELKRLMKSGASEARKPDELKISTHLSEKVSVTHTVKNF